MELLQAKNQFVQLWGNFGTQWGINRSMAQIHALLMVSEGPMSTDEIMEALQISRGNANMNIRDLVAWNLIYKETAGPRAGRGTIYEVATLEPFLGPFNDIEYFKVLLRKTENQAVTDQ